MQLGEFNWCSVRGIFETFSLKQRLTCLYMFQAREAC